MLKYLKIIDKIQDLPTLPTIYSAFNEASYNKNSNSKTFAELISPDQATCSRILKVVNSAFFGFLRKVDSIPHAITLLGIDEVKNIITSMQIIDFFNVKRNVLYFRPVQFWRHSIATGILARLIAESLKHNQKEQFFLSGILHDIGKLFLFIHEEENFELCLKLSFETNKTLMEIEREIIGIDHTTIGLLIAKKWNLPDSIIKSIQYHHDMNSVPPTYGTLIASIHISDIISRFWELGYAGDHRIPKPSPHTWEILEIKPGFFHKIEKRFFAVYDQTCTTLLS